MDNEKKAMFLQNMTHLALSHAASTPNVAHPDGKMSHDKMLGFIAQMAGKGLQHFADGGTALGGPSAAGNVSGQQGNAGNGLMGGISDLIGTSNKFQASSADIQKGTNANQLNASYGGVQDALAQQKGALGQQQGLTNTLTGQATQGAGTQNALTDMLMQRSQGGGPNPAQAQLNQATGQNIQQQAALMAGQRGASANAGLSARQNAMQGASTQQNAVGQAATMNANQQIAAQNQLQSLAGAQVGQGQGAMSALTGATNQYGQAQQNEQGILQNANTSANNAAVAMQSNINDINSGVAKANQSQNNNIAGSIMGAISGQSAMEAGSKAASALKAHGGMIHHYDEGGWVNNAIASAGPSIQSASNNDVQLMDLSSAGKGINSKLKEKFGTKPDAAPSETPYTDANFKMPSGPAAFDPKLGFVGHYLRGGSVMSSGGEVPAMVSPKERYLNPAEVKRVMAGADPMKLGKEVPGKASVKGDSLKNDTVKATLDEGGVVIPRHITTHKMASEKAAEFVRRAAAKRGKK